MCLRTAGRQSKNIRQNPATVVFIADSQVPSSPAEVLVNKLKRRPPTGSHVLTDAVYFALYKFLSTGLDQI